MDMGTTLNAKVVRNPLSLYELTGLVLVDPPRPLQVRFVCM